MAEQYKFPDEIEAEQAKIEVKTTTPDEEFTFEIEDDTPPVDRNKAPMPKEIVKKLEEADEENEELDPKAQKERLLQYKKVWNDERRAKEAAERERHEAINLAKKALEDNKKLRDMYTSGEKTYMETVQNSAGLELQNAQRDYKEALESGDSNAIVDAQTKLNEASYRLQQSKQFKPSALQEFQNDVQMQQVEEKQPKVDPKTQTWLDENPWYGTKKAMSSFAVGIHEELIDEYGSSIVGSNQYFKRIDQTMRKKFPEYFDTLEDNADAQEETQKPVPKAKPTSIVAPATRSTSSKQVKLKTSQMALLKKLGLTPEQYAREQQKLENQ